MLTRARGRPGNLGAETWGGMQGWLSRAAWRCLCRPPGSRSLHSSGQQEAEGWCEEITWNLAVAQRHFTDFSFQQQSFGPGGLGDSSVYRESGSRRVHPDRTPVKSDAAQAPRCVTKATLAQEPPCLGRARVRTYSRPRISADADVQLLKQTSTSGGAQGNEVFRARFPAAFCRRQQFLPALGGRAAGWGTSPATNAARERSRVQTLRHAFLELQKTLPSVPPDTKLSKLDVLLLATTYIAHLTRSLQDEEESPGEGLGTLRGDGYLHPVKKWPMRSRLYIGATGQFLTHSAQGDGANQGETSTTSPI
ncbi:PREDICTED: transcription factor 24 [Pygoscelis adeliae]|uniref:transcription factor 24 n=1 Tax=Pygoscelis adeliae TaxID=9238 RepID=UPI0004F4F152|nr:PREDICTED: transcription factor 24 [Pygoscelis adeliae]